MRKMNHNKTINNQLKVNILINHLYKLNKQYGMYPVQDCEGKGRNCMKSVENINYTIT